MQRVAGELAKSCSGIIAGQMVRVSAVRDADETSSTYCFAFAERPGPGMDVVAVFLVCELVDNAVRMRMDSDGCLVFQCGQKIVKDVWALGQPSGLMLEIFPLSVGMVDSADATSLLPARLPEADSAPVKLFPLDIAEVGGQAEGRSTKSAKVDAAVKDILAEVGLGEKEGSDDEDAMDALAIEFLEKSMSKTLRVARKRQARKRKRSVVQRQGGQGKKIRKTSLPSMPSMPSMLSMPSQESRQVTRSSVVAPKGERPVWDAQHQRYFTELWRRGKFNGLSLNCSCAAHNPAVDEAVPASSKERSCRRNVSFGMENAAYGPDHLRLSVVPEFKLRLLRWDAAGVGLPTRDAHKVAGGLLLSWYASAASRVSVE